LDEVGIDVGAKVAKVLHEAFGARMAPPPGIERLLGDQRLGRKNQRGFYEYSNHHKGRKPVDESIYGVLGVSPRSADLSAEEKADLAERCLLQMVNEAAHCFGEGILRSARDGDIGAIFGLGFPPYLGGPFRYVDARGAGVVVAKLEQLENKHGERFRPAPALVERAKKRSKFHE
jgi:3-hydroxyacyl-CoA dehydrogenase/enoyl-CoA hydratase/3-hydroxybutyryl-CoA epimerase